jgi:MoaA/NifB/PqqE/SkfB family radical SAM enzyme
MAIRIRKFEASNYYAIHCKGKTLRMTLDPKKPITELKFPEFYDIKITGFCAGNCLYCYQNSKKTNRHYKNIIGKTKKFFGRMKENERPFQVALGGGNPNQHPDFIKLLKTFSEMNILPNYTTNGMGLTKGIIKATKTYCGGVAVSTHSHLKEVWERAVKKLVLNGIKTNLHLIISDQDSIDQFVSIYKQWNSLIDYFVLLPYTAKGRAVVKKIDYAYLRKRLKQLDLRKIAFGANFYSFLRKFHKEFKISLYEPEILSKYLDYKDMKIYKSSFS